jgi:hypothetical protein
MDVYAFQMPALVPAYVLYPPSADYRIAMVNCVCMQLSDGVDIILGDVSHATVPTGSVSTIHGFPFIRLYK